MDFYERVKKIARLKFLTIETVANYAGLTIDSYNSYRRHNNLPRADEAVKIAEYLNTSVEYLVTGKENNGYKKGYDTILNDLQNFIDEKKSGENNV